jgi:hypothetical protein
VLDVVISGDSHLAHKQASLLNMFGVMSRYFEFQQFYRRTFGILRAQASHPEVDFRYVIGPQREMSNKVVPVEFTQNEVASLLDLGKKDAKYIVQSRDEDRANLSKKPKVQTSGRGGESYVRTVEDGERVHHFVCHPHKEYADADRQAKYQMACADIL